MKICKNCGRDGLYHKRHGKRCVFCGERYKKKTGLIDKRPTKPHDAVCGEHLTYLPNGDKTIPKIVKSMCNDGTNCRFDPTTMKQTTDGKWIAVCSVHK